jgi:hypothetical protein
MVAWGSRLLHERNTVMPKRINHNPNDPLLSVAAASANAQRASTAAARVVGHLAASVGKVAAAFATAGVGNAQSWGESTFENVDRLGRAAGQLAGAALSGQRANVTFTPASAHTNAAQRAGAELMDGAREEYRAEGRAARDMFESGFGALNNCADAAHAMAGGAVAAGKAVAQAAADAAQAIEAEAASGRDDGSR